MSSLFLVGLLLATVVIISCFSIVKINKKREKLWSELLKSQVEYEERTRVQSEKLSLVDKEIEAKEEEIDELILRERKQRITLSSLDTSIEEVQSRLNGIEVGYQERLNSSQTELTNKLVAAQLENDKLIEIAKEKLNERIVILQQELEDYENKIEEKKKIFTSTIEQLAAEEKKNADSEFYKLGFTEEDIEDFSTLKGVKLNRVDTINNVIYSVYYSPAVGELTKRVLNNRKVGGIYKITNTKDGKIYIGKSTDVKKRWTEHIKSSLGLGSIAKSSLHKTMAKVGVEHFTFELIEECDSNITTQEKYWIEFFESDKYGYNMRKG